MRMAYEKGDVAFDQWWRAQEQCQDLEFLRDASLRAFNAGWEARSRAQTQFRNDTEMARPPPAEAPSFGERSRDEWLWQQLAAVSMSEIAHLRADMDTLRAKVARDGAEIERLKRGLSMPDTH
jgi:hypothetical protein